MENKSKATKSRERYVWLKEHHVCVGCGHEDAEPNRVYCFECAEKRNAKYRKIYQESREEEKEKARKRCKKLYYERKEKGICTKCGKRKVYVKSTIYCMECYLKENRRLKRYCNGIPKSERPNYGLCYTCGKRELYSASLCTECYERQSKNMKRLNANPTPSNVRC